MTEDWTRAYFGAENLGFPLPVSSVWSQSSRFPVPERPADDQAGGNGGAVLGKSTSPKNVGAELHDQVGGFSQIFLEFQPGVWSAELSSIVSPLAGAQIEQCSSWGVEDCSPSLQKKHKKTAGQRVNGKSGFHPQDWWTCLVTFKVSLCRSYFIKPPFMPIHSHIFPWHPHETAETWRHFPAMFRHSDRARTCSARKLSISQELDVKSWKFHCRSSFLIEGSRHMMV